jgi:hypothetical protein
MRNVASPTIASKKTFMVLERGELYVELSSGNGFPLSLSLVGDESVADDFIGPNLREISIKCP